MDEATGPDDRPHAGQSAVRAAATWLVATAAVVTLWASYVPAPGRGRLDAIAPFTQVLAMRPALATLVLLAAVAGLVATWRAPPLRAAFAVVLIGAVAACAQIAPRAFSHTSVDRHGGPGLTVLTANTLLSSVTPEAMVALVRRSDADVIALPETNADRARAFAAALTLARGEHWEAFGDLQSAPGDATAQPTSLVVRVALGAQRLPTPAPAPRAHGQVGVRLTRVPGAQGNDGPVVLAAHPLPPAPAAAQADWRRDLLALRAACRAGWIIAGDFNATIDHSPMRALHDAGCRDAASTTGAGLRATWSGGPFGVIRPAIDHVLASGRWDAAAAGVLTIEGSDHRAVWARIARRSA